MVKKNKEDSYLIISAFFLYLTIILFSFSFIKLNFYIFIAGTITLLLE